MIPGQPGQIAMTGQLSRASTRYTTMIARSGRKDWAIIHYVAQVQSIPYLFIRPERLTTISGPLLGYLIAH